MVHLIIPTKLDLITKHGKLDLFDSGHHRPMVRRRAALEKLHQALLQERSRHYQDISHPIRK